MQQQHNATVGRAFEEVQQILREVLGSQEVVVYLFGSWARGEATSVSDIDIALDSANPLPPGILARLRERLPGVKVENRWIPEEGIQQVFTEADLVLLPYTEASQSGVIAIAFGMGLPVVVTPVGGLREQVSDGVTGRIAYDLKPAAIAEATAEILRSPKTYERYSKNAGQLARGELSWETLGSQVSTAVHSLRQMPNIGPLHYGLFDDGYLVPVPRSQSAPMKILHVITGLTTGGAEIMLYKLLKALPRAEVTCRVVSLTEIGPIGERIRALGIPVESLGMRRGLPSPLKVLALAHLMRHDQPDLVQAWMYHANLMAGIAAKLAGSPPVIWGIRQSDLDPRASKRSTRLVAKAGAWLSRPLASRILCNANQALQVHTGMGYTEDLMGVIPNGFDIEVFRPDAEPRCAVRQELDIPDTAPLVGLIARLDPQKGHETFFAAARILLEGHPQTHFLLAGDGVEMANPDFAKLVGDNGLALNCRFLGRRRDVPRLTAAFDIAVSSSAFGEGFSNTVGEAMATAVPCAVTDVGDSAAIVGDTGRVVAPRDAQALAGAIADLIALGPEGRAGLGQSARRRIEDNFALPVIAERYLAYWREALGGP